MVFSDTIFLFVFLPIVFLLYFLSKEGYRNSILLLASLMFYAFGEPKMVLLMIVSIFFNYFFALGIKKYAYKKAILFISILYNLGVLFIFKYLGFSVGIFNLLFRTKLKIIESALPIGISFYTFQSMSYVIDVYTGKAKVQRNILNLGLYQGFPDTFGRGAVCLYVLCTIRSTNANMSYHDGLKVSSCLLRRWQVYGTCLSELN